MGRKEIFWFRGRLAPAQIWWKCEIAQKKWENFCFFNIGCGYSTLVSLANLDSKKRIVKIRYTQLEKTPKNCLYLRHLKTMLNEAVFGHILNLVIFISISIAILDFLEMAISQSFWVWLVQNLEFKLGMPAAPTFRLLFQI